MENTNVTVIKATGEPEPYSETKVRSSIKRAGLPDELSNQVIAHIESILYENIPTKEIYKHIIEFLNKSTIPAASAKYSLKHAVMQLGPSGYPFEKFISFVLDKQGYSTKTNQILQGKCVQHEVDVIASKNGENFMIEAKFHNKPGARSDLKVTLYTYARYSDLIHNSANSNLFNKAWLITNTKVTSEAKDYANCIGMKIISWSYPEKENLRELIEKSNLHPITALYSLSAMQKQHLIKNDLVLCNHIVGKNIEQLMELGLNKEIANNALKEAQDVCSYSK
ncbi:ATPase [Candidatus Roizmanbacteria bacterium CG22_combo_CG10-13_8_21_14_all_38_20]|uniref:ATPase n=1 Tax=Candidatus Roizmanbacteria bacterium CG22_combo_CG10-13_8_21_14_all_38_20 TaxID=1974862 RepID=A0A2H0BV66_9BACT|nr:ATPase [Candidatus Microgenomates bacterium]PIP61494.1 MAG: ATPase [Candidatus Roizmanbacteria bacterium CG22_combo_CG10-13_8_21_14_all_38_20]PJC32260.1 MAG: ATPase [Candidatus Roizmanbacteria bacterium CG_4_9_14_0_2_um_filter_38_17]